MDISNFIGKKGKYLNATKVKELKLQGKQLTLTEVTIERMNETDNSEKPVISFKEINDRFVLNATNTKIIAGEYGTNTDKWIGKKVSLALVKVTFNEKLVDSVQVVV